jgi:hypothetical protein
MQRIGLVALLCALAVGANAYAAKADSSCFICFDKGSLSQTVTSKYNPTPTPPANTSDPCFPSHAVDGYSGEVTEGGITYHVEGIKCADGRKIETDRVAIGPAITPPSNVEPMDPCEDNGGSIGERSEYVVEGIWLVEWTYLLCADGTKLTISRTKVRYADTVQPADPQPAPAPAPAPSPAPAPDPVGATEPNGQVADPATGAVPGDWQPSDPQPSSDPGPSDPPPDPVGATEPNGQVADPATGCVPGDWQPGC